LGGFNFFLPNLGDFTEIPRFSTYSGYLDWEVGEPQGLKGLAIEEVGILTIRW